MPRKKYRGIKLFGWTISISFISLIALLFLFKSANNLWEDWFAENSLIIFIISLVIVIMLLALGMIKISEFKKRV